MVKYRAAIWSFLKLTALYFTMSDIIHVKKKLFCILWFDKKKSTAAEIVKQIS